MSDRVDALLADLYPLCRSITGDGVRRTLERIGQEIPLELSEVPSGTAVLDWVVPDEWNIDAARITAPDGSTVADFADHNLHVVSYSEPIDESMPLGKLQAHLHSLPEQPELIPYRTSYYSRTWGFCLPDRARRQLVEGTYRVEIDSQLEPGHLSYGEYLIAGELADEVLFSVHICHPSLANDNVAGMALATELASWIAKTPRRLSYRFLFIPGTIGSITWLAHNRDGLDRIRHGLVLACLGDKGHLHWKQTRHAPVEIDRVVEQVLSQRTEHTIRPYEPWGYDERQFSSPGFDLAVGLLTRTPNGEYDEYHTSADDLDFLDRACLDDSLGALTEIVAMLEGNRRFTNLSPFGEPQLGRRGLYGRTGGVSIPDYELGLLWVLNQSDGSASLLDIAQRSGLSFEAIAAAAEALCEADLLTEAEA
ncbi:MAG: DUF4910 domain-containing protein [Gaiellaceae bacterium]